MASSSLRVVRGEEQTTGGKLVEVSSSRDRGPMASRFSQLSPETCARIQSELEYGRLRDWADVCDRMRQRDADILATAESRLSVISGADVVVEPGIPTGDPERDALAADAATWVDSWLRSMPVSRYAHESLDGILLGLSVHEIEWGTTSAGLVPVSLQWLHLRRFCYGSDWRPRICDLGGDMPYSSVGYELEPDRFVCHEPRAIPGYPTGGIMRPVLWLFMIKSWAMQFWTAGAEQFAWPVPFATVPRGADDSTRTKVREFLETLSQGHAATVDEGVMVQLLESSVKDGRVWQTLIEECNRGIAKALLGMTDLAEPTRVGAYAAVETRKGATVDARVLKDERALAMTWERDLIEPALRLNADRWDGIVPPCPRLRWSIAAKRSALDAISVRAMTVDEVRASQGRPELGGAKGALLWRDYDAGANGDETATTASAEAMNGAQLDGIQKILASVYAGLMPSSAARALILAGFPEVAPTLIDQMLADAPKVAPVLPESPQAPSSPRTEIP